MVNSQDSCGYELSKFSVGISRVIKDKPGSEVLDKIESYSAMFVFF